MTVLSQIVAGRWPQEALAGLSTHGWRQLLEVAESEGVAPLCYRALCDSEDSPSRPIAARTILREAYTTTWFRNERMFSQLEALARSWHDAGIPVVLLKGACYALTIYPDPALRPMVDVDVLTPEARLEEAVELARQHGFSESLTEASPGLTDLLSHHVFLEKPGPVPMALEIHHALIGSEAFSYSVPLGWFWTQIEPLPALCRDRFPSMLMLTPHAQLLYASAHAMLQHGGRNAPLLWFYDLHAMVEHYGGRIDWALVLRQAAEFGWASALRAALEETEARFRTGVPANVRARLALMSDRHEGLVARRREPAATHTIEEFQKLQALNWRGRLRLSVALLVPSPAYIQHRYGLSSGWSVPLYYGVRWWGILKDGLRTVRARLRTAVMTGRDLTR